MSEKPMKKPVSEAIREIYIARLRWEVDLYYTNRDNWISVFSDIPPSQDHIKTPFAILPPAKDDYYGC